MPTFHKLLSRFSIASVLTFFRLVLIGAILTPEVPLLCGFFPVVAREGTELGKGRSAEIDVANRLITPPQDISLTAGEIKLFDGKTLLGWKAESDADWQVRDGALHVSKGTPGLLRTTSQFDQFALHVEFSAQSETNSGVFLLTSPRPTDPAKDCYEVNIVEPGQHEFGAGAIVARRRAAKEVSIRPNQWQTLDIIVEEERVQVFLDEQPVCDYRPARPLGRGYIGLQYNSGPVSFRNITLRPLGLPSLLPSDAPMEGWLTNRLGNAQIKPTSDGGLRLTGGPGQLETRDHFADFVLYARCRLNRADTNSGIFFRCIPTEMMNGYECQLNHSRSAENPDRPADWGTGGIFRRQEARSVQDIGEDWFDLTLIAVGPHISTWVNGQQVVDWSDTRAAHSNPRRGKRLEAGSLILQAHDETTDVEFRELSVRELAPRNR